VAGSSSKLGGRLPRANSTSTEARVRAGKKKYPATPPANITTSLTSAHTKKKMDDYSDEESLSEYTETGVLLGYAESEAGSDTISHLGGSPVSSNQQHYLLQS
jgi:hypothetical protein